MYNDFIIIGLQDDPAKIRSTKSAVAAVKLIAQAKARFVSRGDNSRTHKLEKSLWSTAGIEPKGAWYIESGQGIGLRSTSLMNVTPTRSAIAAHIWLLASAWRCRFSFKAMNYF
jgi:ABC-type tungstate transport system permease subunit